MIPDLVIFDCDGVLIDIEGPDAKLAIIGATVVTYFADLADRVSAATLVLCPHR